MNGRMHRKWSLILRLSAGRLEKNLALEKGTFSGQFEYPLEVWTKFSEVST